MKFFQINEADLCDLEHILPELLDGASITTTARAKTQIRRLKAIISNVRWGYGPPDESEVIPSSGERAE